MSGESVWCVISCEQFQQHHPEESLFLFSLILIYHPESEAAQGACHSPSHGPHKLKGLVGGSGQGRTVGALRRTFFS